MRQIQKLACFEGHLLVVGSFGWYIEREGTTLRSLRQSFEVAGICFQRILKW